MATDFEKGLLVGLLIGEGHFGGDGRQPQVTLRMNIRHQALFEWLLRTFPGGRLYGPYHHDGRSYFQWMARGAYLAEVLVPLLDNYLGADVDGWAASRYQEMKSRYARRLQSGPNHPRSTGGAGGAGGAPDHDLDSSIPGPLTRDDSVPQRELHDPLPRPAADMPAADIPAVVGPPARRAPGRRLPGRAPSTLMAEEPTDGSSRPNATDIFRRLREETQGS